MTPNLLDPARHPEHPSLRDLESVAFGPATATGPAHHIALCEACRTHVGELRAARASFLARRPARPFVARVLEIQDRREPRWRKLRWLVAIAATLAFAWVGRALVLPAEDDIRLKGNAAPRLELRVSRGGGAATALPPNSRLRAGDVIKFVAFAPHDGFVFVANLDEQGRPARYYPASGSWSAPVRSGEQVLPGSTVLDDFSGQELIILVFSEQALSEQQVFDALDAAWQKADHRLSQVGEPELPGKTARLLHEKMR